MKQRILQQATHLFVLQGYHAISMREISAACGLSKAALYYHFRDKEALLLALLVAYIVEIHQIILTVETNQADLRNRLLGFVRAVLAHPADRRSLIRLGSQEFSLMSREAQAEFGQVYQDQFISKIVHWMETGQLRGELKTLDPGLAAWIFLGMLYPFFYPSHQQNLAAVDEQWIVNVFLDGASA